MKASNASSNLAFSRIGLLDRPLEYPTARGIPSTSALGVRAPVSIVTATAAISKPIWRRSL
eukprot:15439511-Alexandrium_andersonii.AAC.1